MTTLVYLALISYLVTVLLVEEDGPFGVFAQIRTLAGINVPVPSLDDGAPPSYMSNGRYFADVLSCCRCTAPYAVLVSLLIITISPDFVVVGVSTVGAVYLALGMRYP